MQMAIRLVSLVLIVLFTTACQGSQKQAGLTELSGTIEATTVAVTSEVGGKVIELSTDEGNKVTKNQVLARIDDDILKVQLQQAEALVQGAEALLKDAKRGSRLQEVEKAVEQVNQINALIAGTEKTLALAEKEYVRVLNLYEQGGATEQSLDNSQIKVDTLKTQLASQKAQYSQAKAQLSLIQEGVSDEVIESKLASVNQAIAQRDYAKLMVEKAKLSSPLNGVVLDRLVEQGEIVVPGRTLLTVANLQDLWIKIYVGEKDLGRVALSDKVKIKVDAYNDTFEGEIVQISDQAEFTPKNIQTKEERAKMVFAVKVKVLSGMEKLKPGMPADVLFK